MADAVRHVRLPSQDALGSVEGAVDLLYVDGAHRVKPASEDIARWGARVRPGGSMLVHDSFSSIGVTLALLRLLAFGGDFVYVGRERSLAEYRRVGIPLSAAERERLLPHLRLVGRDSRIFPSELDIACGSGRRLRLPAAWPHEENRRPPGDADLAV